MATFRVGVGSFNIKDSAVGVGTETTGHGNLKVEGTLKSNSMDVLGVSTFTRYSGFSADDVSVSNRDLTLSGEYSTTGDIVVEDGASLTVGLGSTACVGTVECISVKNHFSVPVGDTAQRNETSGYSEGTIRYNRDLGTMEFFNGNEWRQFNYQADNNNRGRGLFAGGRTPSFPSSIEFIEISSLGNGKNFGDLTEARESASNGVASHVRGLFGGGYHPGAGDDEIDYVTMASEGNAIDFGNLSAERYSPGGGASSTRGIFGGGHPAVNIIEFVEISTLGNAVDFGDLVQARRYPSGTSSPVRSCFAGGADTPADSSYSIIDFITIASKGNASKFGDLTAAVHFAVGGCSNSVRGLYHLGTNSWAPTWNSVNQIDFITLASEGNSTNFGELSIARSYTGGVSNNVRGIFGGGFFGPSTTRYNIIDFVLISSQGNGQDFGDLAETRTAPGTVCDSHGGLGGY
jgi:hypothetical protein